MNEVKRKRETAYKNTDVYHMIFDSDLNNLSITIFLIGGPNNS